MAFYQNVFDQEFQGYLGVGDKRTALTFIVDANPNKPDLQMAWNIGPYDLSTYNTLTLNYAWDVEGRSWIPLAINVAGATPAVTTAAEVVAALNANVTFAEMFTAEEWSYDDGKTVLIKAKPGRAKKVIKLYISNSGAERQLRFNKKAGVAELPTYFARHTIANRFSFDDSAGLLIELDETDAIIDVPIIEDAGFVASDMLEDWELLTGRSTNVFTFKKQTVDGTSRVTEIIEYGAGAKVGDLAIKTTMTYTAAQTSPDKICKIPYVLQSGDLVTP
jgi:hypothetical protein